MCTQLFPHKVSDTLTEVRNCHGRTIALLEATPGRLNPAWTVRWDDPMFERAWPVSGIRRSTLKAALTAFHNEYYYLITGQRVGPVAPRPPFVG